MTEKGPTPIATLGKPDRRRLQPIELAASPIESAWLPEPELSFANDARQVDPKVGIPLYGPKSLGTLRHKQEVHVGFIGTSEAVERSSKFLAECADGVDGDDEHHPFPGFRADRGFRCELRMPSTLVETISRQETTRILSTEPQRERLEEFLRLLEEKLRLLVLRDHPLDYVVLTLPEDLFLACRSAEYHVKGEGMVHRDLRRAFKAMAMRYRKPTQVLLETTTGMSTRSRRLDHRSVIAWNLFTGLYFKVEGLPWGPVGLAPSTCFVGVSFFRPLGEVSTLRTSVVQAFDENGDGLILRGPEFQWDELKQGRSPHLSEGDAEAIVKLVLGQYERERKQLPQRVVIHKSSRFDPAERAGFEAGLSHVARYDLLALTPTSAPRLIRAGKYPPLRGTAYTLADTSFLYTMGYIHALGGYPHGHVPSPLELADHVGDTQRQQLFREVMTLTKMNWNSAAFCELKPITLRFSETVGSILREVPAGQTPEPKYKYYM